MSLISICSVSIVYFEQVNVGSHVFIANSEQVQQINLLVFLPH